MEYWRVCAPCNKWFGFERSYIRHLKYSSAHTQARSYECSNCGQLFLRDDVRERHELKRRCHAHTRPSDLQQIVPAKRDYVEVDVGVDAEDQDRVPTKTLYRPEATEADASTSEPESRRVHAVSGEQNNREGDEIQELATLIDESNEFEGMPIVESRNTEIGDVTATTSTADPYVVDWDMNVLHDSAGQIVISSVVDIETSYPTDVPELSRGSSAASHHSTSDTYEDDCATAQLVDTFLHFQPDGGTEINTDGLLSTLDTSKSRIRLNKASNRCTICKREYERNVNDLRKHFYRHLEDLMREPHVCEECDIGFAHKQDLDYHRQAAERGTCGFSFTHTTACSGHHPPQETNETDAINDHDRCIFGLLLREWEQSQLHLHQMSVQDLVKLSGISKSLSLLSTRSSPLRQSITSLVYSLKSFNSEHHDTDLSAKLNDIENGIGRLQVGKVSSLFRKRSKLRQAKREAADPRECMRRAAEQRDFTYLEELLGQGCDFASMESLLGPNGEVLLHAAVREDSDLVVKELLKAGVPPDCRVDLSLANFDLSLTLQGGIQFSLLNATTPLIRAADVGSHAAIATLIAAGADVDIEIYGTTALGAAIASRDHGIVDILLRKDSRLDPCWYGRDAIWAAAHFGADAILEAVLQHVEGTSPVQAESLLEAIDECIQAGRFKPAASILRHWHRVCASTDHAIAKLLGCSQDESTENVLGDTAHMTGIDLALKLRRPNMLRVLLTNSMKRFMARGSFPDPALQGAASELLINALKCLFFRCSDTTIQQPSTASRDAGTHNWRFQRGTGIDLSRIPALETFHINLIHELLEYGACYANRFSLCTEGPTLLYIAAAAGAESIVRLLLSDVSTVNTLIHGDSALYAAARQGHPEIVRMLLSRGADLGLCRQSYFASHCGECLPSGRPHCPLTEAVFSNYEEIVRSLLALRLDNTGTSTQLDHFKALFLAVARGSSAIVRAILSSNQWKITRGASKALLEIIIAAKERSVNSNNQSRSTALNSVDLLDICEALVEAGAEISKHHAGILMVAVRGQCLPNLKHIPKALEEHGLACTYI